MVSILDGCKDCIYKDEMKNQPFLFMRIKYEYKKAEK